MPLTHVAQLLKWFDIPSIDALMPARVSNESNAVMAPVSVAGVEITHPMDPWEGFLRTRQPITRGMSEELGIEAP